MEFKKQKPIYLQIADTLCERILREEWKEDERLASVRDVAVELGVNPNTALRAFDYLQGEEIIYNRRGIGYFVGNDAKRKATELQKNYFLKEELPFILQQMKMLGLTLADLEREAKNEKY